jgi:putative transposase
LANRRNLCAGKRRLEVLVPGGRQGRRDSGFPVNAKRDRKAAVRFLREAIRHNGKPEEITVDKSGANLAVIESHNTDHKARIEVRQVKYLNNIVEQDHRAIKRLARPMLGFKTFWSAAATLARIELMHMIRKGQLLLPGEICPAR